jgi:hypothetical protein
MGEMPRASAGLEDVIDMSSSLPVFQFSSPLLCKRYKALAVSLDKPRYKILYLTTCSRISLDSSCSSSA